MQISVKAYKKFNTQYKPIMLNFKCDVCDALKLKNHPVYRFPSDTWNGSNLMDPCPIQVDSSYYYMLHNMEKWKFLSQFRGTDLWNHITQVTGNFQNCYQLDYGGLTPKWQKKLMVKKKKSFDIVIIMKLRQPESTNFKFNKKKKTKFWYVHCAYVQCT